MAQRASGHDAAPDRDPLSRWILDLGVEQELLTIGGRHVLRPIELDADHRRLEERLRLAYLHPLACRVDAHRHQATIAAR